MMLSIEDAERNADINNGNWRPSCLTDPKLFTEIDRLGVQLSFPRDRHVALDRDTGMPTLQLVDETGWTDEKQVAAAALTSVADRNPSVAEPIRILRGLVQQIPLSESREDDLGLWTDIVSPRSV